MNHVHPRAEDRNAPEAPLSARILVVDDVAENRDLLKRRLTRRGYDVSLASSGQSALDAIAEGNFDLVLLDIMMPGMSGLETLEQLRGGRDRGTLPVIMVSARSESEDIVQALELGANEYIRKPINFPVAFARIETHLSLKRADDALRRQLGSALERIQAVTKLRETEEFMQLVTDNLPVMIGYFDADMKFRFVNRLGLDWFACSREDLIGKTIDGRFPDFDMDAYRERIRKTLDGELQTFDGRQTYPDGITRHVAASYTPHFDGSGICIGFFCIVQDVSQQIEIERQFNQAQKMEAIGQLTGGIAHDFNNILMVADGYTRRALQNLNDPEAIRKALEEVLKGTDHAAKLTKHLLSFSRRQIIEKRVFRVEEAILEIKSLLRKSTGEQFEIAITSHSEGACVDTDPSEFSQALVNLVINARDAMPRGGRIEISSRLVDLDAAFASRHQKLSAGRFVEVSVNDYGIGIDQATLAHIFEPFFTTKDQGKGTGLGLAMVYGFAQNSGGAVIAESGPGAGATFKIYLPAVDQEPQTIVTEVEKDHLGQGETILLVEDDPSLLEIVREMLDTLGYNVLTASDGFEAIEIDAYHETGIDLLLTDVVMPTMGGFETAEIIRQSRPDIKVVFMSGYPNRAGIDNENLPENSQYLQKPVKPAHIAQILRQELDKPDTANRKHSPTGNAP